MCQCSRLKLRNRCGYSSTLNPRSRSTCGVTQPAKSFSRGKTSRSSTSTSAPPSFSRLAAADPAGPPPTTMTSAVRMLEPASVLIHELAGQRDIVILLCREQHLKQLQGAAFEGRGRAGQIQPPHAHEVLVKHRAHSLLGGGITLQPMAQRQRVVQADVLDIEHREIVRLENWHHLTE